jgi:hypothetical protein
MDRREQNVLVATCSPRNCPPTLRRQTRCDSASSVCVDLSVRISVPQTGPVKLDCHFIGSIDKMMRIILEAETRSWRWSLIALQFTPSRVKNPLTYGAFPVFYGVSRWSTAYIRTTSTLK